MNFPCRKIVGASAILLIALGSIAPVQLTHAHVIHGAEGVNSLAHPPGHFHGHSHEHPPSHAHSQQPLADVASASDFHTHIYLPGVEVVVPQSPYGDERQPDDSSDSQDYLGKVVKHEAVCQVSAHPPIPCDDFLVAWHSPCTTRCEGNMRRDTARFSTPLCDTARHERSGVLIL